MPLLKNLMKEPQKEYIYWPDRKERVELFIKELDKFIDSH